MEQRRRLKRRASARLLAWVALLATAALLASACNRGADKSDDSSPDKGFRLSLSKRDAPLLDGDIVR